MEISVVVSTHNRASHLPRLFAALSAQTIEEHVSWELIVVDNRSTDDTAEVVERCSAKAGFPVTYVFEGRKGKSFGLNTGIALARGRIIALTDDDAVPAPDWLERVLLHFEMHNDVPCVGGRVELHDPADAVVAVRLSPNATLTDVKSFDPANIPVIGCNMAMDAELLRAVGLFDVDLGPGSRIGIAEDLDLLYRLTRSGHRIAYDPGLLVFHNHGRRTESEVGDVTRGYLIGRGAFYCKYLLQADGTVLRRVWWEVSGLLVRSLRSGVLTRRARASIRRLGLLFLGALRYLRYRQTRGAKNQRR